MLYSRMPDGGEFRTGVSWLGAGAVGYRHMRLLERSQPYQRADRQPLQLRHGIYCQRQRPVVMELLGNGRGTTATCSALLETNGACGSASGQR